MPVLSPARYGFGSSAYFAWWREESFLDAFLMDPVFGFLRSGWHVRMKLYRRWGEVQELKDAIADPAVTPGERPVVAVTLARLKISQAFRFTSWGKPVERQIRDHAGQTLALAAVRPLNTFCTFSIWKSESAMTGMVHGRDPDADGISHQQAMRERLRRDFHHEFCTMRFVPVSEVGLWRGRTGYSAARLTDPTNSNVW